MSQISELIAFTKANGTNTYKEINFGNVPNFQAQEINSSTGIKVNGAKKILNNYAVAHIFKEHGNDFEQRERGQKGITDADIELIPKILSEYDAVAKGSNNSRGKQAIVFKKQISIYKYFLVMSVDAKSDKVNLFVNTMYAKR